MRWDRLIACSLFLAGAGSVAQPTEPLPQEGLSEPLQAAIVLERTGFWLLDPKVVGGKRAKEGDDPWQVALVPGKAHRSNVVFCGGAVIANNWILTAAHCVNGRTKPDDIEVLSGTIDRELGGQRSLVAQIILHPDYKPGSLRHNDIALLRLEKPVAGTARAIGLPALAQKDALLPAKAAVRVTGWGALEENGTPVRHLRYADLVVIPDGQCRDEVSYPEVGRILPSMVCAGTADFGKDACQGDSGGPLTAMLNGTRMLAGIVSWGDGCGRRNKPGVYTSVVHFSQWVERCVSGQSSCRTPTAGQNS
jgi:secreted trypsin-like serine protease